MSNITKVSDITKPTKYILLDNTKEHTYLPKEFMFVPTVSSESSYNNITETVKNALSTDYISYYTCIPQDFVYNINVRDDLQNVVYKTANKEAYVYKVGSEENTVYKYCTSDKVDISVLGDANIDIGNVTVKKGEDVLKPIAKSLSCTVPNATKEITIPKDYDSLEINSSDVYFRQESNSKNPSWVTISGNVENRKVSFKNIQISKSPDIIFNSSSTDNSPYIIKDRTKYLINENFINPLENAKGILEKAKNDLKNAENNLENAENNLENAENNLEKAKDILKKILYDKNDNPLSTFNSLVTLATKCRNFYNEINDNDTDNLPEPIKTLGNSNSGVSEIFSNFEIAKNLLTTPLKQENLQSASSLLRQVISALNNLPEVSYEYTYLTDETSNDLVGVITDIQDFNGFYIYKWLGEILVYCANNPSINKFNFLDKNKKMIIPQTTNLDELYDLVYLEGYKQNGNKILPDGDSFLTTDVTTES